VVGDVAHDKFFMYGFCAHAGIDGALHCVLWAKVALYYKKGNNLIFNNSNNSIIILLIFLSY
jgi:hypothetical protein